MSTTKDAKNTSPKVPEPTAEEVAQLMESAEEKYGCILPKSEAKKLARLIKELDRLKKAGHASASLSILADDIRGILVEYRFIPDDPAVTEKAAWLLWTHYGVTLTDDQLGQAIQFITRKLWYEEGLDSNLEECLDDLIQYSENRQMGVQPKDKKLHDEVRQAFDWTVQKLTGKEFDPLFKTEQ